MLHQIQGMYIQIDHISSIKLLIEDPLKSSFGIPNEDFKGTIELSLCGQSPIHISCGDAVEDEFNIMVRLMGQIP